MSDRRVRLRHPTPAFTTARAARVTVLAAGLAISSTGCSERSGPADLILTGGKIWAKPARR